MRTERASERERERERDLSHADCPCSAVRRIWLPDGLPSRLGVSRELGDRVARCSRRVDKMDDGAEEATLRVRRKSADPNGSIQRAIQENDSRRLAKLLGQRVKLRLTQEDLALALMEAISQGKAECVPPLLAARADPNCVDEDGKTPLIVCMDSKAGGSPAIVRDLLQSGASPNKATSAGQQTALHMAARKGYQVAVKILLAHGARPDKPDSFGNTALMYAAREGHFTALKMMLDAGADADAANRQRETALMAAARAGHLDCAEELLEYGADPDRRDARGQTPLMVALRGSHMDVVEVLMSYQCDVNSQNTQTGKTVLHWAVQTGDVALVHAVLRMGAEPNVRDRDWDTPFITALLGRRLDVVGLLVRYGCDVTVTDRHFNTGLHLAAREGLPELLPALLEAGLDCDLKTSAGQTPLMLAAFGGHADAAGVLLENGAHPDVMDRHRATALAYAVASPAPDDAVNRLVRMLIRAGCCLDQGINLERFLADRRLNADDRRLKNVQRRAYAPLEVAFLRGRPVAFMMILAAGCSLRDFPLDSLKHGQDWLSPRRTDFRTVLYLLKLVKSAKKKFPSLRDLCRRPAVLVYRNPDLRGYVDSVDLSKDVRSYLNFDELDTLEKTFKKAVSARDGSSGRGGSGTRHVTGSEGSPFSRLSNLRSTYTLGTPARRRTTSNASYRSAASSGSSEDDDVFRMHAAIQNRKRSASRNADNGIDAVHSGTEHWVMTDGRTTEPAVVRGVVKVPVRQATAAGAPPGGDRRAAAAAAGGGRPRVGRSRASSARSPPTLANMLFVTPPADDVVRKLELDHVTNRDSVVSNDTGFQSEDAQPRPESPTARSLSDLKSAATLWRGVTTPLDAWDTDSVDSAGVASATGSVDSRDTDLSDFSRGSATAAGGGDPAGRPEPRQNGVASTPTSTPTAARKSRIPVRRRPRADFNANLASQFIDVDDEGPRVFRRTQSCRKY